MKWIRIPVVLLLAGALAFIAVRLAPLAEARSATRQPLVAADRLDPERVDRIAIVRGEERFEFVRDGERWRQREPIEHALDAWSVRQLVSKVRAAEVVRVLGEADAPEGATEAKGVGERPFGEVLGRIELSMTGDGSAGEGRATVIELGRRSLGGRALARVAEAGAPIVVVDGALHDLVLDRDMRDFRRRDLFADLGEIASIAFRPAGGGEVILARRGRGFELDSPVRTRADRSQAEDFIAALRRARSDGFVVDRPREPAVYGLAPPAATLVVTGKDGTATLLVGEPVALGAQDRFAMIEGSDTVFRLPAATLGSLIPRTERLVDSTATATRPSDVARIDIDSADGNLRLDRELDGWRAERVPRGGEVGAARTGSADADAVERLLATLSEARAGSLELQPLEPARIDATITLRGFAGEPLATIRRAATADGTGTVLDAGDGVQRVFGSIDLPLTDADLGLRFAPRP
ncbi:MAG: hypothetical protein RI967_935 [Planctomycetota bacterium]